MSLGVHGYIDKLLPWEMTVFAFFSFNRNKRLRIDYTLCYCFRMVAPSFLLTFNWDSLVLGKMSSSKGYFCYCYEGY